MSPSCFHNDLCSFHGHLQRRSNHPPSDFNECRQRGTFRGCVFPHHASCEQEESFSLKSKHKVNGHSKLIAPLLSSLLSKLASLSWALNLPHSAYKHDHLPYLKSKRRVFFSVYLITVCAATFYHRTSQASRRRSLTPSLMAVTLGWIQGCCCVRLSLSLPL